MIMADKGLNFSSKCAAECANMCPQEEECTCCSCGSNKMYTHGTIKNSQRTPSKINKDGTIAKVRVLVKQMIL